MPTIDDLRSTLGMNAHSWYDDGLAARASAVHGRIGKVRNRRRAAVVAGTAAAAAGVVAVAALPSSSPPPAPADRMLVGLEAPATMTSLGYTYDFATGSEGATRASVTIGPDSGPLLVSWATGGSDQHVTVKSPGGERHAAKAADFADFVAVSAGTSGRFVVNASGGDVALAVYELDPTQGPAGVTRDGITFREQVGTDTLLGAAFGEPGQAAVRVEVPMPAGELRSSYFCSGAPTGAHVHVAFGRGSVAEATSCDDPTFDPGGSADVGFPRGVGGVAGESVIVRMWVTQGSNGPTYSSPNLRMGLGLYEAAASIEMNGWTLPDSVEYQGHVWQHGGALYESTPGADTFDLFGGPREPDRLALIMVRGLSRGQVTVHHNGEPVDSVRSDRPTELRLRPLLLGGDWELSVRAGGGVGPRTLMAVAPYERIS